MSNDDQIVFATSTIILELQTGDKSFGYLRSLMPSEQYDNPLSNALKSLVEIGFIKEITVFMPLDNTCIKGYKLLPKAQAKPKPSPFENHPIYGRSIDDLNLTVRTKNCLLAENLKVIGDVITKTETWLLKTPSLGKKSLAEIKERLDELDLELGIRLD